LKGNSTFFDSTEFHWPTILLICSTLFKVEMRIKNY